MKKENTLFMKVVRWAARIAILILAVALIIWAFGKLKNYLRECKYEREEREYKRMVNSPTYLHDYDNKYVSPYVIYHDYSDDYYSSRGYLFNTTLGQRTETGIQWICQSSDGDSLTCYCKDDKRGYFNRFSGAVVVPPQYEKAWIFSEGLACVMEKGTLHFIDHKGQKAIDKEFPYAYRIYDYCFHNGLCNMLADGNRIGLIDKQGNWVVEPVYYDMTYYTAGFWMVYDSDFNYGLLDENGQVLLPIEYDYISIHENDSCIFVRRFDNIEQVLDFNFNVINPCNITAVYPLDYATDEYNEEGELKRAVANCLEYRCNNEYGLMDKNGKIITPPIYLNIKAIGPDLFRCWGPNGYMILDSKGKMIEQDVESLQNQTK